MLIGVTAGRALVCFVMIDDLQSLLLFPEAFAVLAMGKAYAVSRSAIVPTVVRDDSRAGRGQLQAAAPVRPGGAAGRDPRRGRLRDRRVRGRARGRGARVRWPPRSRGSASRRPRSPRRRPPKPRPPSSTAPASAWPRRPWASSAASSASSPSCCCSTSATTPPGRWALVLVLTGAGALVGSAVAPAAAPRVRCEERMLILRALGGRRRRPHGRLDRRAGRQRACSPPPSPSCRRPASSPSTRSCSATRPDANRGRSFAVLRAAVPDRVGASEP